MSQAPLYAGVELGGTKCICILATGPDDIRAEVELPTGAPDETLAAIGAVLDGWHGFSALGIASFGPLQLDRSAADWGGITGTPKPGWAGTALVPPLAARFAVPVAIDTDVAGAGLAEQRWGVAAGLDSFAYITIGTGIGVASFVDGRPIHGLGHPEPGHMRVPRPAGDNWPGACPHHGDCVEGLAAGSAIDARIGRSAATLTDDDPVWTGVVHVLAGLLHNLVLTTAPQRIIIGGGVLARRPHLLRLLRPALVASLASYGPGAALAAQIDVYLAPPALGVRAGPLGAIAIAAQAA